MVRRYEIRWNMFVDRTRERITGLIDSFFISFIWLIVILMIIAYMPIYFITKERK